MFNEYKIDISKLIEQLKTRLDNVYKYKCYYPDYTLEEALTRRTADIELYDTIVCLKALKSNTDYVVYPILS